MGPSASGPGTGTPSSNKPLRTQREIGGKRFRISGYDQYVPARRVRARRRRFAALAVIVLAVLATGGWYGYQNLRGPTRHQTVACARTAAKSGSTKAGASASPSAAATLVPNQLTPSQVVVNVYNATSRNGLAGITASQLQARGFIIGKVANDPLHETIAGTAQIRGSQAQLARMQLVSAEVPGSQQMYDGRNNNTVDLVVGNAYQQLSTPSQVSAAITAASKADEATHPTPICR